MRWNEATKINAIQHTLLHHSNASMTIFIGSFSAYFRFHSLFNIILLLSWFKARNDIVIYEPDGTLNDNKETKYTFHNLSLSLIHFKTCCVCVSVYRIYIFFKIVCDFWTSFYVNRQNWTELFRINLNETCFLFVHCMQRQTLLWPDIEQKYIL